MSDGDMQLRLIEYIRRFIANRKKPAVNGVLDTGKYERVTENTTRRVMARQRHYAEAGDSYDPAGTYLCGDCKYAVLTDLDPVCGLCSEVEGQICLTLGSCDLFEICDDNLPHDAMRVIVSSRDKQITKSDAGYMERPFVRAFGCQRCGHAHIAKEPDEGGRQLWCDRFGCHVMSTACCSEHSGHDAVTRD